jgi:hypothetical protein
VNNNQVILDAELFRRQDASSRRRFLSHTAQALLGVSAVPLAAPILHAAQNKPQGKAKTRGKSRAGDGAGGKAKSVIYLFMSGAMSQLDTLDPKPGRDVQGETKAIGTALPGVKLSQHMPQLAKRLKQAAVVRSLGQETGAHGPARYFMRTSYKEIASTRHPALGAWGQEILGKHNPELPGSVVIGGGGGHPGAGFLPAKHSPVPVGNAKAGLQNTKPPSYLSDAQFNKRMSLSSKFDRSFRNRYKHRDVNAYTQLYDEAIKLLKSSELKAFDISEEKENVREKYGDNAFGQGCLLAKRLVESQVRFVEVVSGGWDNHRDIFTTIPDKASELDQALSALMDDLQAKGLLDSTLIVVATEFGRTPKINQNAGRDHHPGVFSGLFAGGGIRGGQVYGASDEDALAVKDDLVSVEDFNATIAYAMGLPTEKEFFSPDRRPFKVSHDGTPLKSLFG